MNLKQNGSNSSAKVLSIDVEGLTVSVLGNRYFLPFEKFYWFKKANVEQILNIELIDDDELRWSDLDIDIELDALKHPEQYPLIAKV